ncbi:MAG: hypothetical protein JW803_04305 [Endomicrobiales bacterium]|nr:hypothetical protein [Endomicrobiales bacterium]
MKKLTKKRIAELKERLHKSQWFKDHYLVFQEGARHIKKMGLNELMEKLEAERAMKQMSVLTSMTGLLASQGLSKGQVVLVMQRFNEIGSTSRFGALNELMYAVLNSLVTEGRLKLPEARIGDIAAKISESAQRLGIS